MLAGAVTLPLSLNQKPYPLGRSDIITPSKSHCTEKGQILFAGSLMQPCVLTSAKLSILILLRRIFITQTFQRVANVLIAIVLGWWLAITFAVTFICTPVKSHWDPNVPGNCGNVYLLDIIDPIPWILTDFAILFAPLPMIWRLQMATRQKVAVGALFLIGVLYVWLHDERSEH